MANASSTLDLIIQIEGQAEQQLASLSAQANNVDSAFGSLTSGAMSQIGAIATNAFVQAGQALVGFGAQSVNVAANFQTSMAVLQQASHATGVEMDQMRNLAVALGNDIQLPGASALDASSAMVELAKAGLSVDNTMAAAKGTLQLAAAAETDAATAAGVVAGALNAFGLAGSDATHIVDLLAGAAGASSASITDLSQGFNASAFAFHAAGQSADDLGAALAILTSTGLSGSDAGTALKNAMMALMAPTAQSAAAMQQYGINVRDSSGNMLPFRDIIGVLQEKLGGLSPAARDAALHTILMGDGMKAMLPLLNAGVSGFDAMKETVSAAGSAQAQAAAQMTGFNGAMGGLSNAAETLQLIIGAALLPVLTNLAGVASEVIGFISTLASAMSGSTDAFAQLSPAMQTVVTVLQSVGEFLGALANEAIAWGSNIVNSLASGMMDAVNVVISVINSIGSLIAGLLAPGSPPAFLPGLTDYGTGAINAYMEGWGQGDFSIFNSISDSIKNALDGIAKATGDKGMNVAALVLGSQDSIAAAISEVRNLGSVSEATFNQIIAAAGPAGPQVAGLVSAYIDLEAATQDVAAAQDDLNRITDEYSAKLTPLKGALKEIQDKKQAIQDQQRLGDLQATVAAEGADSAKGQIALLDIQEIQMRQQINTVQNERDVAVDAAKTKLDIAKDAQASAKMQVDQQKALLDAQNKTNALIGEQTKAMTSAAGAMHAAAGAAGAHAGAQGALGGALQDVGQITQTVGQATEGASQIVRTAGATIETVSANIHSALTPVALAAQAVFDAFKTGDFTTVLTVIQGVATQLAPIFAGLAQQAGQWVLDALPSLTANLLQIRERLFAWVTESLPGWLAALGQLGAGAGQWLLNALPILLASLGTFFQTLLNQTITYVPQWIAALVQFGIKAATWIADALPGLINNLGAFFNRMVVWVVDSLPGWATSLAKLGEKVAGWVLDALPGLGTNLGKAAGALLGWVITTAADVVPKLVVLAGKFLGWVTTDVLPALPGALLKIGTALFNFVSGLVNEIAPHIAPIAKKFLDWVTTDVLPNLPSNLVKIGAAVFTFIAGIVTDVAPKLAELAKKFYTWVTETVVPNLPGQLASIGTAIGDWISGAISTIATKATEIGQSLIDGVKKGISNAAASLLSAATGVVNDALNAAKRAIGFGSPATEFMPLGDSIPEGIAVGIERSTPKAVTVMLDLAAKLVSLVSSGVEAFGKLRDMASIPQSAIQIFVDAIKNTLIAFSTVVAAWDKGMMSSASQFAAKAAEAIDLLSKGVSFLVSLRDFQALPATIFRQFADALDQALREIVAISTRQTLIGLASAQQFAESSAKIIAIIASGVDAFKKLLDFTAPTEEVFHQFALAITFAVGWISHVAAWFQAGAASMAAQFADSAGKVVAIIGAGVDAFAKLTDFEAPTESIFHLFALALTNAVGWITHIAGWFRGYGVEQAAIFAENAGKIIGIISGAVDAFLKLKDFQGVPNIALLAFVAALLIAVQRITWLSTQWSPQAVAAAGIFAENAGKVIGVIAAGVEGFIKLADFQGVPGAAIAAFTHALELTVQQIAWLSTQWAPTVVAAAGVFAQNAGQAVGLIGTGVDAFIKLADFEGVPAEALAAFTRSMLNVIQQMAWLSLQWSPAMITQASTFASNVQHVIGMVTAAMDAFKKLGEFQNTSAGVLTAFTQALTALLAEMIRQVMPASQNIGVNMMQGMINGIVSGQSALIQTMINVVMSAVNAAKNALGIASESSVFRDTVAGNVGAGFVSGLLAQISAVQNAGASLANAAIRVPTTAPAPASAFNTRTTGNQNATNTQQPTQHVYDFSGMVLNPQPGQNGRTLARQFHGEVRRLIEEDTRRRP